MERVDVAGHGVEIAHENFPGVPTGAISASRRCRRSGASIPQIRTRTRPVSDSIVKVSRRRRPNLWREERTSPLGSPVGCRLRGCTPWSWWDRWRIERLYAA